MILQFKIDMVVKARSWTSTMSKDGQVERVIEYLIPTLQKTRRRAVQCERLPSELLDTCVSSIYFLQTYHTPINHHLQLATNGYVAIQRPSEIHGNHIKPRNQAIASQSRYTNISKTSMYPLLPS
jgi:hypothetical protein